ncbi:MAG TPA: MurR/RpiR family transcriptional regulator [Candidatus Dormibacteraeota bacterium]|nr:MurR/RpiR family transcriptional regulator [Candidatus Dormibacteraeota bacterium]
MPSLRTKDDLTKLIAGGEAYSASHRQVAAYLLRDYRRVCFMSASQLAEAVGVSQATVTRFANHLGFGGYQDLVAAVRGIVRSELTGVDRVAELRRGVAVPKALERIVDEEVVKLGALRSPAQVAAVERLGEAIARAPRVYVAGFRSASGMARQFAFFLRKLHPDVVHVQQPSSEALEVLALSTPPSSLLVAIVYPRYPREAIAMLDYARSRGIRTAAVTDSVLSPALEHADLSLLAPASSTGVFDSYSAFQVLASFLFTILATRQTPSADDYLSRFEAFAREADIFTSPEST